MILRQQRNILSDSQILSNMLLVALGQYRFCIQSFHFRRPVVTLSYIIVGPAIYLKLYYTKAIVLLWDLDRSIIPNGASRCQDENTVKDDAADDSN